MLPFINVFGLRIPTYGLCMMGGLYLVTILAMIGAKKKNIRPELVIVVAAMTLVGAVGGAGLLYIIVTYNIEEIITRLLNGTLTVGLVFYGGLIGGIIGAFVGGKMAKIDLLELEDVIVPYVPLGHAIGRIGCLLAGCCHGMEYDGFGAVYYKNLMPEMLTEINPNVGYFPVQPLEAFLDIIIMIVLLISVRKKHERYDLLFNYLLMYAIMRFGTEMLRGDAIRGIKILSTSQWISVALIVLFFVRLIYKKVKAKKETANS